MFELNSSSRCHSENLSKLSQRITCSFFQISRKGEIEYEIEISSYFWNNKHYYILSFLEEKRKKSIKESKELKGPIQHTKIMKPETPKRPQVDLSIAFDEAPRTSSDRNVSYDTPNLKEGTSKETKTQFQKNQSSRRTSQARFFEQNRLTTQFLTSDYGLAHTVDSFLVDDNQDKIMFSSHRDLLEKSSRHFTSQEDFRLGSAPFWESSSPQKLERSLSVSRKISSLNHLFILMIFALVVSGILLITFNNKFSETLLLMDSSVEL